MKLNLHPHESMLPTELNVRFSARSGAFGLLCRSLLLVGILNLTSPVQAGKRPSAPTAPSNLSATALSSSQIKLAWQDNSGTESGFIIQRAAAAAGPWSQLATTSKNTITYTDSGLTPA